MFDSNETCVWWNGIRLVSTLTRDSPPTAEEKEPRDEYAFFARIVVIKARWYMEDKRQPWCQRN